MLLLLYSRHYQKHLFLVEGLFFGVFCSADATKKIETERLKCHKSNCNFSQTLIYSIFHRLDIVLKQIFVAGILVLSLELVRVHIFYTILYDLQEYCLSLHLDQSLDHIHRLSFSVTPQHPNI